MNILIASITTGQGHHATADAAREALSAAGHNAFIVDLLKVASQPLYVAVDKGYDLLLKVTPSTFGKAYKSLERDNSFQHRTVSLLKNALLANAAYRKIKDFKPQLVISTHVIASQIIEEMINAGQLSAYHIGIITDYTIHPIWENVKKIDKLITCSELLSYRAAERGIDPSKLLPLGIPVRSEFTNGISMTCARNMLGLPEDGQVVLVMSGSLGYGKVQAAVSSLAKLKKLHIMAVCGNNKRLKTSLEQMHYTDNVRIMGYVNNVNVLMAASDIIVTKPGGLTVSEALAVRRPLILNDPIPGQEEENAEYLVNLGMAVRASEHMSVGEIANILFSSPERIEMILRSMDLFAKKNSSAAIKDFVGSL